MFEFHPELWGEIPIPKSLFKACQKQFPWKEKHGKFDIEHDKLPTNNPLDLWKKSWNLQISPSFLYNQIDVHFLVI